MELPSVFVWTHDSIFLGEDGPTHQPIEHIASLRAIPNLDVHRPADPTETAAAWQAAINRTEGPSAIVLSRQGLPVRIDAPDPSLVAHGGYVRRNGSDVVVVATGSETPLAEDAAEVLAGAGISARVVSMPCVEVFDRQSVEYRTSVLGDNLPVFTVEAGSTFGWDRYTARGGAAIGIERFGASAPSSVLAEKFGFTPQQVADTVLATINKS
jgi:transketolase